MFLFTRVVTIAPGKSRPAHQFLADVTAQIKETTALDLGLWTYLFGRPVGPVGWSVTLDSMAEYFEAAAVVNSSSAYQDRLAGGGDLFTGPAEASCVRSSTWPVSRPSTSTMR